MKEHTKKSRSVIPENFKPFLSIFPVFIVLIAAVLLWGRETPETEDEKEISASAVSEDAPPELLVTAEQLDRMTYLDSEKGEEMQWVYDGDSLEELNRVLREYEIRTPEEISQFLAQAAVETGAGRWLTELGNEDYFNRHGYTCGTRGAGYLHLTFEYGQMAFAVWMMKKSVPELAGIPYLNPTCYYNSEVAESYYSALEKAEELGLDVSRYARIVYDPQNDSTTGADYIAEEFAWESAGYFWHITGMSRFLSGPPSTAHTDEVSRVVGGRSWQSRREAYEAFYPVLSAAS
ncbi:MAG: hypothetical protein K2O18_19265 [Oscillospiraceae bacterium]|nr:hypothetical protein [Oscillospiraceae bacterium]